MQFTIVIPFSFEKKIKKISPHVLQAAKKVIKLLSCEPRHPSLKTHKVKKAFGDFGGEVFEAYVTKKYRMTWEYGPDQGMITLRNIDNHDECLKHA